MNIVYCGYDLFHLCMSGLLDSGHDIVELFTWPAARRLLSLARSADTRVSTAPIGADDMRRLKDRGADAIISPAYPYKVPDWRGCARYGLNIHPSPLPIGRGPWPLPRVILTGMTQTAVTLHELTPSWDAGDILVQAALDVSETETLESLAERSHRCARDLLLETVPRIDAVWSRKRPQGAGSYWPAPTRADRTITLDMPVRQIDRIVRAFSGLKRFVYIDATRYSVDQIRSREASHSLPCGMVVRETGQETTYAVSDGFVTVTASSDRSWFRTPVSD